MDAGSRTAKRKRSLGEIAAGNSQKRAMKKTSTKPVPESAFSIKAARLETETLQSRTTTTRPTCPLIQTLRQYGLLESVVSCLIPRDLLSLAMSCKATYTAMIPRAGSLDNLLSKMPCSGSGVSFRQRIHHKSSFFYEYPCTEFAQCRTASGRRNIESRPCINCKVTTCDECRIHCVYQTTYEAPSDPEDLPNFTGFVLLDPHEVGILSPDHLSSELYSDHTADPDAWRDRAADAAAGPYHDQGFLDLPLQLDQAATPEKISDVIDVDLGRHSLTTWSGNSQFGFPSPVLRSLCNVTEQRKLSLCELCFNEAPNGYKSLSPELPKLSWLDASIDGGANEGLKKCRCSLRSHVLDRWQCVKCYAREESIIQGLGVKTEGPNCRQCRCGLIAERTVCLWCWGEIIENSNEIEQTDSESDASAGDEALRLSDGE